MSSVLSDIEPGGSAGIARARLAAGSATHGWRSLRKADGVRSLGLLREVWALRAARMEARISRPPARARHACFSIRRGTFATSVYVDVDACIVWRYPDAAEWAWESLCDATLHRILHREQWHDFLPCPGHRWDEVRLEEIGPVPGTAGVMLEIAHHGTRFLFKQAGGAFGLVGDAPFYDEAAVSWACPVTALVAIGGTTLPLHVVRSLRPGDVLKITDPTLLLRASPRIAFPLSLDRGVLIVTDSPSHRQAQPPQIPGPPHVACSVVDGPPHDASSPLWVGELPVGLSFAFEPLALTVAELSALRPGDVVPLQAGTRLMIHASGRPIGEAELVEVEGSLAAEVVALRLEAKDNA